VFCHLIVGATYADYGLKQYRQAFMKPRRIDRGVAGK
jgi:hypothetical protein